MKYIYYYIINVFVLLTTLFQSNCFPLQSYYFNLCIENIIPGGHRFHQTVKQIHGTKKIKNPRYKLNGPFVLPSNTSYALNQGNFYFENIFFPPFMTINQNLTSLSVWRPNATSFIKLPWSPCTGQDGILHPFFHIITFYPVDALDPLWIDRKLLEGRDQVYFITECPTAAISWQLILFPLLHSLHHSYFSTSSNHRTPMHVTSLLFCRIKPNSSIWHSRPFPNWPLPTV